MPKTVAINGTRLDEIRMPLPPTAKGTIALLSYPMSQIRLSREVGRLSLIVPAYLAVELYRIGILPQDATLPVEVSIGGRPAGWYTVSDVRYPESRQSPFGEVNFTLTRVLRETAGSAADTPSRGRSAAVGGTYVTDITHYLDTGGEMARMPAPARKLASFLTLVIEAATGAPSAKDHDSRIRCRAKACKGSIRTSLAPSHDKITWYCPSCGHHGVITNWQETKWNQLKGR